MFEEVTIIRGFYKGYRGIIIGKSENIDKTKVYYKIHLEANGVVTTIPDKWTLTTENRIDFSDLDYNEIPSNVFSIDNNIFYNISDTPFQKDLLNDNDNDLNSPVPSTRSSRSSHSSINENENTIEDYIDNVIDQSQRKPPQDYPVLLRSYNTQFSIKGISILDLRKNYPSVDKNTIDLLMIYVEDICNIIGIEPVYSPQSMYISHIDKILEIIHGKTEVIPEYIRQKLIKIGKTDDITIKDNKIYYTKPALKTHVVIGNTQLQEITAAYFYYYINNVGIRSMHNERALAFMNKNSIQNTIRNYYFSSLITYDYFSTNKVIKNMTNEDMLEKYNFNYKNMNKFIKAISLLQPLDYTLLPDNEISSVQTNTALMVNLNKDYGKKVEKPMLNFVQKSLERLKKRELIKQKGGIVIEKITNESNLTKRVEHTNPLEDKLILGKASLISTEKHIVLFRESMYKLYLFIKEQEKDNPNNTKIETDLKIVEELLTNIEDNTYNFIKFYRELSSFASFDQITEENSKVLPLLIQKGSPELKDTIFGFAKDTFKKSNEYTTNYLKTFYSNIPVAKNNINKRNNDSLYSFTYLKIKEYLISKAIEGYKSGTQKNEFKFIIDNYDKILNDTLTSSENNSYKQEIMYIKNSFHTIYNSIIYGESSKNPELIKLRNQHFASYANYYKNTLKVTQLENNFERLAILNQQPAERKYNKILNNEISKLIEEDTNATKDISEYTKMLQAKGVVKQTSILDDRFAKHLKKEKNNKSALLVNTVPLTFITSTKRKASQDLVEKSKKEKLIDIEVSKNIVNNLLNNRAGPSNKPNVTRELNTFPVSNQQEYDEQWRRSAVYPLSTATDLYTQGRLNTRRKSSPPKLDYNTTMKMKMHPRPFKQSKSRKK